MLDDLSMEKNRLWRKLVPFRRENVFLVVLLNFQPQFNTPRKNFSS